MSTFSGENRLNFRPPPCVIFEDDDLLVVNKPPGLNTHAPAPYAGEGLFEWLRNREPRWSGLGIAHRLDKETSGLMVFGISARAHKSLGLQFESRRVGKRYYCMTDRPVDQDEFTVVSAMVRAGDRYFARPLAVGGVRAETRFRVVQRNGHQTWLEAQPITGRTHQIRVHASESGFPLLGDKLYGGTDAGRLALHSSFLSLEHPDDGRRCEWTLEAIFSRSASDALRDALFDPRETNAWRVRHGAADGHPGGYLDRWGLFWLAQLGPTNPGNPLPLWVQEIYQRDRSTDTGLYLKRLRRDIRSTTPEDAGPEWVDGERVPDAIAVRENGVNYELSFQSGYSVGLFLDQRDNRRRLLTGHIAPGFAIPLQSEVLNTFAYTCAFSVCAALGGHRTTSLDLSRKYLDWGRRHFELNGLDPASHDFIFGDTFEWLHRLARKQRRFGLIILDPPTFSRSRERGDFRAEHDYGRLVTAALSVLEPGGILLASTNAARLAPEDFLRQVRLAIVDTRRKIQREHYSPQPIDFPVTRDEPAYLKTVWLEIG